MKKFLGSRLSCLIVSAFVAVCFVLIGLAFLAATNIGIKTGGYSIDQVIVSNNLTDKRPAVYPVVFHPSDTVFCTVRTTGVDGIVGMRWFYGDEVISQAIVKTKNNSISSYIKQSSPGGLPEGSYHVEIFIVEDQPIKTIYFEVKNQPVP
jgi:hypothetical protein